jgi:CDP-glucose 4,6-dehydratase
MAVPRGALEGLDVTSLVMNFWHDLPVFVTGSTGFVSSWLVKRLLGAGADATYLVRDWVPQYEMIRSRDIEGVRVVRGDVRDRDCLGRAVGENEINTVFHLAAQAIVGIANRNPISRFETNIQGTWNLLEACRRSPAVQSIVIASSDKAYGGQPVLRYGEDKRLRGRHPYDASKSCADLIAHAYAVTYHLPVAITRCGNFYGDGDLNRNRIVPGTVRSALREERPYPFRWASHPRLLPRRRWRRGIYDSS